MPKVSLNELGNSPASVPVSDGPDLITRINDTINNFKDLVAAARSSGAVSSQNVIEGDAVVTNPKRQASKPVGIAPPKASEPPAPALDMKAVKKFWALFCLSGYADKTVAELLTELGPHTPKQLVKQFGGLINAKST